MTSSGRRTTNRAAVRVSRRGQHRKPRRFSRRIGRSRHARRCARRSKLQSSHAPSLRARRNSRARTTSSVRVRLQRRRALLSSRARLTDPTTCRLATSMSRNVSKRLMPRRFNRSAPLSNLDPSSNLEPSSSHAQSSSRARSSALKFRCAPWSLRDQSKRPHKRARSNNHAPNRLRAHHRLHPNSAMRIAAAASPTRATVSTQPGKGIDSVNTAPRGSLEAAPSWPWWACAIWRARHPEPDIALRFADPVKHSSLHRRPHQLVDAVYKLSGGLQLQRGRRQLCHRPISPHKTHQPSAALGNNVNSIRNVPQLAIRSRGNSRPQ